MHVSLMHGMHISAMHIYMILDPDACVYDAHIYDPRSLTLMHVCMMHISMILKHACMYGACIYGAANFVTDERTNEQGDSRSRKVICMYLPNI